MRSDLPSGTVTFLFTDVEGSTNLLHELGAEAYAEVLAEHRRVIREACAAEGGVEVDTQGDAFFFAFPTAPGALAAAEAMTEGLASGPLRVRIGLHTGEPLLAEEGYVGDAVHFAARVAASGHGGQVILSAVTAELVEPELTSLGSHRLKDIAEPVAIYQLGDRTYPPLKTIANTNLPASASSFLGREEELYEADLLLQEARLVTVTGPGGAGKTRFALELATRAREERFSDYRDGVFSCFFASLRDATLVLATIGNVLNVQEQPGESALETLSSHLEGKTMLLLLDNFEHVLDAASELSELLSACSGLTLLCTSRELLRIQGERPFDLPPLQEAEGVSLFCERADVEPSEEVATLCSRLEGLPLAIELAAARTRILTPAQLLERLSSRLDLLKAGRDADPRQQTLRATVEWSYELLSPEEQQLFARLSVFVGGCTLEAAEEVCDADLDNLQSLVEKSLLRFTDGRYWMLETIREFAAEHLEATGEAEELRRRHAGWVLELAARAEPGLEGAAQQEWMTTLEDELANIRAAHVYLADGADVECRLDLIGNLWNFWYLRGGWDEARKLAEPALTATEGQRSRRRAHALHAYGVFAARLGDVDGGKAAAHEGLEIYQELGDSKGVSWQLSSLAILAADEGDLPESERLFMEALRYAEDAGDARTVAFLRGNFVDVMLRRRDFSGALKQAEAVEQSFRELGLRQGVDWMVSTRAFCLLELGQPELADRVARESLAGHLKGDIAGVLWDLTLLAECARRRGEGLRAAGLLGSVAAAIDELRLRLDGPEGELYERVVGAVRDDVGEAFDEAFAAGRAHRVEEAGAHVLEQPSPGAAELVGGE